MKTKVWLVIVLVVGFLICFFTYEVKRVSRLEALLPPRYTISASQVPALIKSNKDVYGILGTGSMQPYIPAGNPKAVVAYCVTADINFDDLKQGDFIIYKSLGTYISHQLDTKIGSDWMVSGSHNPFYDQSHVTRDNYISKVIKTYVIE